MNWREPDGNSFQVVAKCLDISKLGMRVELDKRIAAATVVNLQSMDFRIAGVAVVKHCRAKGLKFVAGLQFAGGLEWFRASESEGG